MSECDHLRSIGADIKLTGDFTRLLLLEVRNELNAYHSVQSGAIANTPIPEVSIALKALDLRVKESDVNDGLQFTVSSKFTRVVVSSNNPPGTVVFKRIASNAVFEGEVSVSVLWVSVRQDCKPTKHQFKFVGEGWPASDHNDPKIEDPSRACSEYAKWLSSSIVGAILPGGSVHDDLRLARRGKFDV